MWNHKDYYYQFPVRAIILFYHQDSFCLAVLVNVNGSWTVKYIKEVQILLSDIYEMS